MKLGVRPMKVGFTEAFVSNRNTTFLSLTSLYGNPYSTMLISLSETNS